MGTLPNLYVEGPEDISVISALLSRHGIDTRQGKQHLFIRQLGSDDAVLNAMPSAIRASLDRPVGFVIDIDVTVSNRWDAIRDRLATIGVESPVTCPADGFIAVFPEYLAPFGIWLMPDCMMDGAKMEHLIATLIPDNDPLWPHAKNSVSRVAEIVDEFNKQECEELCRRFRDVDVIKAEVHTWLAWRERPGAGIGAAVNAKILECDSPQAMAFLRWLKRLYGFNQISV